MPSDRVSRRLVAEDRADLFVFGGAGVDRPTGRRHSGHEADVCDVAKELEPRHRRPRPRRRQPPRCTLLPRPVGAVVRSGSTAEITTAPMSSGGAEHCGSVGSSWLILCWCSTNPKACFGGQSRGGSGLADVAGAAPGGQARAVATGCVPVDGIGLALRSDRTTPAAAAQSRNSWSA
jgi:hypothetical protein